MIYITTNHGTGDTYMSLAFANAVARTRGEPVTVLVPPQHKAIMDMFPDVVSLTAEGDISSWKNAYHPDDDLIVAHPSAVPKRVRIDHLCLLARRLTHADLWRAMLELPPDEPMPRGHALGRPSQKKGLALLIPESRSMPNAHPEFWDRMSIRLADAGWNIVRNQPEWPLAGLLDYCAQAEWVIGPQCGVMSIICHAFFPCRKTFAVSTMDGHSYFRRTYPYAYVDTFAGEDYADVDEVKIDDPIRAVEDVMRGANAYGPRPSGLVTGVQMTLTHGDFFDRLSILEIKTERLEGAKRAAVYREYLQHREAALPVLGRHGARLAEAYAKIKAANAAAWDHNERAVSGVFCLGVAGPTGDDFAEAARHNRERVRLKNQINAICSSAHDEIKSYYGGESP